MNDSFAEWLTRLRAGDDAAARVVFQRFAHRLVGLARCQFHASLRYKVDPEDVVQSAYKSFFRGFDEGRFTVGEWDGLWGLLTLITLRKCADRVQYHRAECRDAIREVPAVAEAEGGIPGTEALDREPTPLEAAILSETVEHLLASLDEDERPIVELSLQGYTTQEISQQLERPERSVRRLRERLRNRLEPCSGKALDGLRKSI
jgi:RNA polymerase sigma-70 factor (ECF subfamily)